MPTAHSQLWMVRPWSELPLVVTGLCKALATWWRRIGNLLQHCHNSRRLTRNSLATHSQSGDHGNAWQPF